MKETDRPSFKLRQTCPILLLEPDTTYTRRKLSHDNYDWRRNLGAGPYPSEVLIALALLMVLNILDYFFTVVILDQGGNEVNPIVHSAMAMWGDHFWIWKFGLISACSILLCLFSNLRYVRRIIFGITSLYLAVIFYQIALLSLS